MKINFLSPEINLLLDDFDLENINEIRLRIGFNIKILFNNEYVLLNKIITVQDISEIISNLTEQSLYAFNERIKEGFLTTNEGIRIGLAGECVFDNGKILTMKNFTSLNIRIPHNINDCSNLIFPYVCDYNGNINNSLIISPPFCGKTTILKDLILKTNKLNKPVLVIDERGEFSSVVGENIDFIKFCDKNYAFDYALRSMSPSIVFVDELGCLSDWNCAQKAVLSGVKLIASCHAESIEDVVKKEFFKPKVFSRYFLLDNGEIKGVLKSVYNERYELI